MNLSPSNLRRVAIFIVVLILVSVAGFDLLNRWSEYQACYNTMSHKAYSRFNRHPDYRAECASRTFGFPFNY